MGFGMEMVENAATGIIGQGMNLIFGGAQDRRQIKQQQKLTDMQSKAQKEMIDHSNAAQEAMQMSMWDKTNFAAQVEQAKKAGLSPGAIFSKGGGAGGATTGGGGGSGSISGGSAGDPNAGVGMGLQMASQLALQKAQKENIEADTENKKAEGGLSTAKTETEKELAELKGNERTISDATMKEQRTIVEQQAIGAILDNEAKRTGINLDKEKIKQITTELQQRWESLRLEGTSQEVSERNMEKLTEAMLWGAGIQAAGNIVRDVVGIVTNKFDKGSTTKINKMSDKGYSTETRTTTRNR